MAKRGPKPKKKADDAKVKLQATTNKDDAEKVGKKKKKTIVEDKLRGLPNKNLYRIQEIAGYFSRSDRTIRRYIDHGHFKIVRQDGAIWIPRQSLIEFLNHGLGLKIGLPEKFA